MFEQKDIRMTASAGRRPIQIIRRSAAVGAWGGRGAILLSAIDSGVIGWNAYVHPIVPTAMTILGWSSLIPLAILATLFTRHVRVGIPTTRSVDGPKSKANDHLAISGWMCLASALIMALVLIHLGG